MDSLAALLAAAVEAHRSGRRAEAESLYGRMLAIDPGNFDALHMLGVLEHQAGNHAAAVELIGAALDRHPAVAAAHNNLAAALEALGRLPDAEAAYRTAAALDAAYAETRNNLGALMKNQGRSAEAIEWFRAAIEANPGFVDSYNNLAIVLGEDGRAEEAIECYRRAIETRPDFFPAHFNLGNLLAAQGKAAAALECYNRAAELRPQAAHLHNAVGHLLKRKGEPEAARAAYQRALDADPSHEEAHRSIGLLLQEAGDTQNARDCYRRALSLHPESVEARWMQAMSSLVPVPQSEEQARESREEFARELLSLDEWFDERRSREGFKAVGSQQPFYLPYREENNRDLLARYGSLCSRLMAVWQASRNIAAQAPPADGPIRVGIVSNHFREHSVWNALLKGWLKYLDRDEFRVFPFYLEALGDAETAFARSAAHEFIEGSRALPNWAEAIVARRLHVLIYPEVGMDPMTIKLASCRLAPVQAAAWGHFETSGLPTMDYYLSAEAFEPLHGQEHYSERLVRLPNLGCAYGPLDEPEAQLDVRTLGLDPARPILVCPGVPFKYAPRHDNVYARIAARVPGGQLVFFRYTLSPALFARFEHRLRQAFRRTGVDFERHVVVVDWLPRPAFCALLRCATVYLDTLGCSGFNTVMQAVQCGLPVATMEGRFMRGRLGSAVLRRMALHDLVAATETDYIERAIRLATDVDYRNDYSDRMARAQCLLYDDRASVRALERFLAEVARGQKATP